MTLWNTYSITLTTNTPIRIGGKSDPLSEADNPVAVVGGRICIPGPSLKGALRAEVERYLNDGNYDTQAKRWPSAKSALQPCIPATRFSLDEQRIIASGHFRRKACRYPCDIGPRGDCGRTAADAHDICPACYLFGAQGLIGFVSVPFLFTDVAYDELYSARMERTTRTVMRGTNRPYQLVPPETKFVGNLEVLITDDLLGWEFGRPRELKEVNTKGDAWLASTEWSSQKILDEFVITRLQAIRHLGGYRSKGFGDVEISTEQKSEAKPQAARH